MSESYLTVDGRRFEMKLRDREAVSIGELPWMTTVQFADYASRTLAESVIPGLSAEEKMPRAADMKRMLQLIEPIPTVRIEPRIPRYENPRLRELVGDYEHDLTIAAHLDEAVGITYYADNPFVPSDVEPEVHLVYERTIHHTVEPSTFYTMAHYVLVNYAADVIEPYGTGSPPPGLPPEVKDAFACIEAALQQ